MLRLGAVFHLEHVESLSGGRPKGRYVVNITREQDQMLDREVYVVAFTSSLRQELQVEAVALPWSRTGQAATGFRKPTWAMPGWLLRVKPSELGPQTGPIPRDKLTEILRKLPPDRDA